MNGLQLFVALFFCLFSSKTTEVFSCTAIAVTGGATKDGTPLLAHTDDAGGDAGDIRVIPVPRTPIRCSHCQGFTFQAMEGFSMVASNAKESDVPQRPVYKFESGYPRLVSYDRGEFYEPVEMYNGKKVEQEVHKPLGYIDDVSPVELLKTKDSGDVEVIQLPEDFTSRNEDELFRYGYFDQDYGMMNEMQLSIVESTCGAKTVGWSNDVSYGYNMFGIAALSKVALERCVTARCAVQVMGSLAEKYGFFSEDSGDPKKPDYGDSAEALIIGDRFNNVWVFHILTGEKNSSAIWAGQRVPDGHLTAVANGFIIREIDFDDSDNFLTSKDIKQVAERLSFWDPKQKEFDFTAVFGFQGPGPITPLYVGRRIWRIFDVFAPSLKLNSTIGAQTKIATYPFSVKPDEKIHLMQLFTLLKDHYEGTQYDMTQGWEAGPFGNPNRFSVHKGTKYKTGGWERPISIWRSLFSFVSQIQPDSGKPGILWYGPDKPHGTVYAPFRADRIQVPKVYRTGMQSQFDGKSAWRVFNFVNNWAMLRFNAMNEEIKQHQTALQHKAIELVDSCTTDAKCHLLQFSVSIVEQWWEVAGMLIAKFSDGYYITGEQAGGVKSLGYPDWWLAKTSYVDWPGKTYTPPDLKAEKHNWQFFHNKREAQPFFPVEE